MTRPAAFFATLMVVASAVLASPGSAHADAPGLAGMDAYIEGVMQERHIPGLALAVLVDGDVVHRSGYGISNLELGTPVTPQSRFNLASVSKSFTAALVMRLVQDGRVALDDPIIKHLDGLPVHWLPVTVAQLLSHTSGIPSFSSNAARRCNPTRTIASYRRGDAIAEVACHPLEFAPGSTWRYGDTGYYLLGMLIERVTGGSYEAALERWITRPLGMPATHVLDYSALLPQRVAGYAYVDGAYRNAQRFELDEFANGGLVSSLDDMTRLILAFTSDEILRDDTRKRMWTPARLNDDTQTNYGLGLGLTPFDGHARFGHTGGGGLGFATAFTHFPDDGVTVIVLANADQPNHSLGALANTIASRFFGSRTSTVKRARADTAD